MMYLREKTNPTGETQMTTPTQIKLCIVRNLELDAIETHPWCVYPSLGQAMSYNPSNPLAECLQLNGTQVRRLMNKGNKAGTKKLQGINCYAFITVDPIDWAMMQMNHKIK